MKYVSVANRWWFVVAVAFIVIGVAFVALPFDWPYFTGAPTSGLFIGGIGLAIVALAVVEALFARRRARGVQERNS